MLVENPNGTVNLDVKANLYQDNQQPLKLTLGLGASTRAIDLEKTTKEYWDKGSVAGVRELMKISIADNPDETGEPIDILKLTKDGPLWIQEKPTCKGNEKAS